MKKCSKCGLVLPLNDFRIKSKAKGTYHAQCKPCFRVYSNAYYHANAVRYSQHRRRNARKKRFENRRRMMEILSVSSCVDCGESDPRVLEFDHVSGEKLGTICEMIGSLISWRRISEEITKCVVRCANCHRRKTVQQLKWYRGKFGA